ncbi:WXG100 family type VII secretion target [Pseudonocardia acaciae]|uniref:WXG100 family type VII secretion target n=1 Tax=Pseudonocardia acaciae TaxID=551276 RepID=UPI00055E0787|nr:hypothetical protein [Pseudonocardia acaciae]
MSTLVAEPEGPEWLEGAGLLSDMADLYKIGGKAFEGGGVDPSKVSAPQATIALGGAGLAGLAAIADPLEALAGAGLGWVIEHVWFLREPLDQLAGNPNEIKAHAQTWHNVGLELGRIADEHESQLGQLGGWQGAAADGYRRAAARQNEVMRQGAASAEELSGRIMTNGTVVATVRSLVRDTIADFVVKLAEWAIAALASAAATAGASLAPIIAGAVASAVKTASKIAELVSKLLRHLEEAGAALGKLAGSAEKLASGLATGANGVRPSGEAVAEGLRRVAKDVAPAPGQAREALDRFVQSQLSEDRAAAAAVETPKQIGTTARDREKWTPL